MYRYAWIAFAVCVLVMILVGGRVIHDYGKALNVKEQKEMQALGW